MYTTVRDIREFELLRGIERSAMRSAKGGEGGCLCWWRRAALCLASPACRASEATAADAQGET
jgi:hypothetical protein